MTTTASHTNSDTHPLTDESQGAPLMRAVAQDRFGGPEVLRVVDLPRPVPLPTEVLVRVRAAGVNPVDWKTRGGTGMAAMFDKPPFVLGWDVSGVVEEVGFGVTTFAVGDPVFGMPWFPRPAGGFAEYVTAPARQFARKPSSVSHEVAAGVPLAALTAWQCLVDTAHVQPGQRVLIHAAAGGVGHLAVQIAHHLGAYVIGTASARHHDWLRSLGADELVDYTSTPFETVVAPVDVVLDLVGDGHNQTSLRSAEIVKPGGLLIAVPGGVSAELASVARTYGFRTSPFLVEPDGATLSAIAQMIEDGELHVEIAQIVPLADAARAHELGEPNHTRGKLVVSVAAETAFVELRRYTASPGRRAAWIDYMESVVIPFQQSQGVQVLGSFADAHDDDGYVWIRRFDSEEQRIAQYSAVYDSDRWRDEIGPVVSELIDVDQSVVTRAIPTPRSTQR